MPGERIITRFSCEIIRLKSSSLSANKVYQRLCMLRYTVREELRRRADAKLSSPLAEEKYGYSLEVALYAS